MPIALPVPRLMVESDGLPVSSSDLSVLDLRPSPLSRSLSRSIGPAWASLGCQRRTRNSSDALTNLMVRNDCMVASDCQGLTVPTLVPTPSVPTVLLHCGFAPSCNASRGRANRSRCDGGSRRWHRGASRRTRAPSAPLLTGSALRVESERAGE